MKRWLTTEKRQYIAPQNLISLCHKIEEIAKKNGSEQKSYSHQFGNDFTGDIWWDYREYAFKDKGIKVEYQLANLEDGSMKSSTFRVMQKTPFLFYKTVFQGKQFKNEEIVDSIYRRGAWENTINTLYQKIKKSSS